MDWLKVGKSFKNTTSVSALSSSKKEKDSEHERKRQKKKERKLLKSALKNKLAEQEFGISTSGMDNKSMIISNRNITD